MKMWQPKQLLITTASILVGTMMAGMSAFAQVDKVVADATGIT